MNKTITLYHLTNEDSAKSMLINGIGLDISDYEKYIISICEELNVPTNKILPILDLFKDDTEANGGVSFFQKASSCLRISHYAKYGGEWRSQIIERVLKRISRMKKTPYETLRKIGFKYLGSDSKPVIVQVTIPIHMVENPEKIGQQSELYTKCKVPTEYIIDYTVIISV